ncbi:MAG: PhoPQ-activated pathogenicity-related family protein [Candidatus Hydrogenedentes bacterium]|nr:PhoPQ-activated pathogenicity-related family protein [Candidatus Hydrogenedentota bacterium]
MNAFFRDMRRWAWCALVVAGLLAGCAHVDKAEGPAPGSEQTALDRYVKTPDASYKYALANTIKGEGYTAYVLDMTSQTWRTTADVDRPVWQHWLTIIKPDKVVSPIGFLFISGGSNGGKVPEKADQGMVKIALATNTVTADLQMIPNQPLVFAGETQGRKEDALISYTWDKFLRTGDETWPARLPMTKAAVRAMDSVTSFCESAEGGGVTVNRFVVAGGSKRGWTTWTTAAVDKRVVGIVPAVINMLNLEPSFKHHWEAYGFWAPAVGDYTRMGLMDWMGTPEYHALLKIVEPYEYRSRYTMPKLILNATGDEFFLPDSTRFYLKDLPGETYVRNVPNSKHSLDGTDALESVAAFHAAIVNGSPRPKFTFEHAKGTITVKAAVKPSAVKLWQATNPKARDFRVDSIGKTWTSTDVADQGNGVYTATVAKPKKGWTAYMMELTYDMPSGLPLKFTTEVYVTPDTLPFKYKAPKTPQGGFMHGGKAK